jgi:hypothetical protein
MQRQKTEYGKYGIIYYAMMCDRTIAKKAQMIVSEGGVALRPTPPFSASVDAIERGTEITTWRSSVAERAEW